jgi:phage/plasmid primase-like uncharacterized protein
VNYDALLALLKRVRKSGHGHVALCPAHDDRHHSLSLRAATGRILIKCHRDCSLESICDALGIRVRDLFDSSVSSSPQAAQRYSDEQRLKYAERIWREATRPAAGTAVENYLRNRGITCPIPRSIRFVTVTCDEYPGMDWPALCAGIQDGNGKFTGLAATAVCADGSQKAPFDDGERRIYGPYLGGAVRLSNQLDSRIAIGEGIETMLSVQQATGIVSWAALSASNLPHVKVPDCIREVIICADADPTGERKAQELAARLVRERRTVRIAKPYGADDFNDLRL